MSRVFATVLGSGAWLLMFAINIAAAAPRVQAPDFEIRSWTTDQGLSDDAVTCLQQTPEGFLWVGTERGLVRFDGWGFVPVETRQVGLPGGGLDKEQEDRITALALDRDGLLWFGTETRGVFRVNPAQAGQPLAEPVGLAGERVFCLAQGQGPSMWIGTEQGLVTWNGNGLTRLRTDGPDPAVLGLQVTRSNGVWITMREGLRRYQDGAVQRGEFEEELKAPVFGVFEDRRGSLWVFGDTYLLHVAEGRRFNYFRGGGATQLQVWSICEGRAGELWIGTTGQGLFHFSGGRFRAVDMWEGRGYSDVRAVFLDSNSDIWVGTSKGLVQLREQRVRWFTDLGSPATCLAEDPDGRVWAGFQFGGLASGKAGVLEAAAPGTVPGGLLNLVTSLCSRPDSSLWAATLGNGLFRIQDTRVQRYTTAHALSDDSILALAGAPGGRVWAATADGKVHRFIDQWVAAFDRQHGLTGSPVTAMITAVGGGLWLGTEQGDVLRMSNDQFQTLPPLAGFVGKPVSALREHGPSGLWVGTRGGGLARFSQGQWQTWTAESGLPDSTILGIQPVGADELWVGTARGVFRIVPGQDTPAAPGKWPLIVEFPGKPVPGQHSGWPRSLRSRDGLLWFATDHGVVSFDPADLQRNEPPPVVRIEVVRANGSLQPLGLVSHHDEALPLVLPWGLRDLEIQYAAPTLAWPERTRFRHKLEGFDPEWQDSTGTRRARYGRLPAGDYHFVVEASDAEGAWSGAKSTLAFAVANPAWLRPWAIGLQGLVLITAAASVARMVSHRRLRRQLVRLEQQRAMDRERARIAQDMHDELGAKLTKISFLSERARNDLSEDSATAAKLVSIAGTSRELLHSLDEIVWAVNPGNDTLEHLAAYLAQYAAEYLQDTAVEHDLRIPSSLPPRALTAEVRHNLFLAFEEALSNALKHSGATRIRVTMETTSGQFTIQVCDNGCGLHAKGRAPVNHPVPGVRATRKGMGLAGMKSRLEQVGGRCEINCAPGEGTTVNLTIPLDKASG